MSQKPTALGKAIESERARDEKAFKTTFSSKGQLKKMDAAAAGFDDLFETEDLERIATAVSRMLA